VRHVSAVDLIVLHGHEQRQDQKRKMEIDRRVLRIDLVLGGAYTQMVDVKHADVFRDGRLLDVKVHREDGQQQMKPRLILQELFESNRVLERASNQIFGGVSARRRRFFDLILLSTNHVNDKEQYDVKERQLKHLLLLLQSKFI
jgi:hypothetical protein